MKVLTVTSAGDDGAGLTLREAVAMAGRKETLIRFDDDIRSVTLDKEIDVAGRAKITIDGDKDGDGVGDVYIDTKAHHFTVGANAKLTLSDLLLYGGSDRAAHGASGDDKPSVSGSAIDGEDGESVVYDARTGDDAELAALAAGDLQEARLDGLPGHDGADGSDGGPGENGESAAASIRNAGDLTLVRVGFAANSASGGNGGIGGDGGRGWSGGHGGDGALGAVEIENAIIDYWINPGNRDGGDGGAGGDGGDGGDGGAGGRGGDAALIINDPTGSLRMIDVAMSGRLANGSLYDQYPHYLRGGDGGLGGNGGIAGAAGRGGDGANAVKQYSVGSAYEKGTLEFTGARYQMYNRPEGGGLDLDNPLSLFWDNPDSGEREFWPWEVEVVRFPVTEAGKGGDGGAGGSGGDGGSNGNGGNAALIVNYGAMSGKMAKGSVSDTEAGRPGPDRTPLPKSEGARGWDGDGGGQGGDTVRDWDTFSVDIDGKARPLYDRIVTAGITGEGPISTFYDPSPNPVQDFGSSLTAADGAAGADGTHGAGGTAGKVGQARKGYYSEGVAKGTEDAEGLVYLTGVRQSDDFGKLLFSLVRVGDTSEAVSVTYTVGGVGPDGVGRNDFRKPGQLSKTVTFDAIDQQAATFDSDGKGIARIEIDLRADGIREGAEGFRIRLSSGDVDLGTDMFRGVVWDGDYRSVSGTPGNDRRLNGSRKDDVIDGQDGNDGLFGKAGRDVLLGGAGRDILNGGGGGDTLNGGGGGDRFVFGAQKSGKDVIEDFGRGDVIDLTAHDGLRFRDLAIRKAGGDTLVKWDGGSVLLEDVRKVQVDASDFDFA